MKKYILMFLMSFIFLFSTSTAQITSFATETQQETESSEDNEIVVRDGFVVILEMMLNEVFSNPTTNEVDEEASVGSIFNAGQMLKGSLVVIYNSLQAIYDSHLYSVFIAIGVIIMTIYFMIDLATKDVLSMTTDNRYTIEKIIRPFVKYIICLMFILNIKWILIVLLGLSQGAYNQVPDSLPISFVEAEGFGDAGEIQSIESTEIVEQILDMVSYKVNVPDLGDGDTANWVEEMIAKGIKKLSPMDTINNVFKVLPLIVVFILPWLISVVCNGLLVYVILSRIVSIVIQGAMAPIAMGDIYSEGSIKDTKSWSFVRNFASLCFQSVVISLVLLLVNTIISIFVADIFAKIASASTLSAQVATIGWWANLAIQMTILKCVQVGTVLASANESKKLFGGN